VPILAKLRAESTERAPIRAPGGRYRSIDRITGLGRMPVPRHRIPILSVLRKQAFVAKLCQVMSRHALLGMSMSALKDVYKERAAESDRKRTVTPYTFCSNVLIDWVLGDIRTGAFQIQKTLPSF
jgi:hypothetical protein